ncbi:MAG: EF2563 family selenium-dependent molybdenum hydroxylase system protein [Deltaproteobacteria bacterium]|nr:EF2563 family selenium-dependent molybdenum hydroxylase system protein [Deltaproteobacteria bacterium]
MIRARVPAWRVVVRGAGEMATGVAHRLYRAGLQVVLLERERPTAIRRAVAFSEAVLAGRVTVEGVAAVRCDARFQALDVASQGAAIPLLVDPEAEGLAGLAADALMDARMLKRDPGPRPAGANGLLVVGLGPGHLAGETCDLAIETERGHTLGRVIERGPTLPYSGRPHEIGGHATARLLRAPHAGTFRVRAAIGDLVAAGAVLGEVDGRPCPAGVAGLVRGLLPDGTPVVAGQKLGDVDPRGAAVDHRVISDKARAVGGGALEAVIGSLGGRLGGRRGGRAP